jgi:hypothetical protein
MDWEFNTSPMDGTALKSQGAKKVVYSMELKRITLCRVEATGSGRNLNDLSETENLWLNLDD